MSLNLLKRFVHVECMEEEHLVRKLYDSDVKSGKSRDRLSVKRLDYVKKACNAKLVTMLNHCFALVGSQF